MNSELAGLLELVAAEGADAFYTGPVARKMVEQINQRGGCFTLEDLSRYQPKYRTPVKTTYRGLEVAAFAPPSGGCAVVEMLNILEHSDLAAMGHNTAASIHAIAEAMKLGFADRSVALGDPDFVQVDVERLTSKAHAAERYALSSPETAGEYAPAEGIEAKEYPGNTSHFAVMDRFGNAVSQTQTVRDWFGCGIVVDGCGFVLNNAMSDFSAKPGALTSQGLTYGSANSIQGGKTPLSSMAPSMVFKDGRPYLAIGARSPDHHRNPPGDRQRGGLWDAAGAAGPPALPQLPDPGTGAGAGVRDLRGHHPASGTEGAPAGAGPGGPGHEHHAQQRHVCGRGVPRCRHPAGGRLRRSPSL